MWTSLLSLLPAITGDAVQTRMDEAVLAGRPLVAHVVVALADNDNQGIVPTHLPSLGDGQSPRTNLYWGARYGVRSYLARNGWRRIAIIREKGKRLERLVYRTLVRRNGKMVDAFLVADAWDGRYIKESTEHFLEIMGGGAVETITAGRVTIEAGGAAHLVAYVGHNGLMGDFTLPEATGAPTKEAKSAMVLACASKPYFTERIEGAGAHALLLTTSLMAPEAYTLDAALRAWFSGRDSERVHADAARAYTKYQKAPLRVGQRLFWSSP